MSERETWYVLEDGSSGDPREVTADDKGVLRHKSGMAVAIGPHGPRSRGVDVDVERAKAKPQFKPSSKQSQPKAPEPAPSVKDMTAAPAGFGYLTRGGEAD